jgi:anaerobic magnesium-protoporphyrin IX monomethyl ester cyclase
VPNRALTVKASRTAYEDSTRASPKAHLHGQALAIASSAVEVLTELRLILCDDPSHNNDQKLQLCYAALIMKMLFVEIDTERTWAVASLGPAYMAAFLRQHGHEVDFFRAKIGMDLDDVVAKIARHGPELIGLSLTSRQWLRGAAIASALRINHNIPVIAGGLHPTFAPEETLARTGIDFVCLGEGEEALLELVDALERGESGQGIKNIWLKGSQRPELRVPISPLDRLPFMARDLLDEHHGCVHVCTQRGCPFPCTYCAARTTSDLYEGIADYGRRRSPENVLAEISQLKETGAGYVIFLDDTFTIHHPWVKDFCQRYKAKLHLPFSLHARVETVSKSLLECLAAAGCAHITYGIESGSERIRRDVLQRPVTNELFRDVFRWTKEAGIMVTANYMLGIPGETRDDLAATLLLAKELEAFDFGYFIFYPYPGTSLYQTCQNKGYLPADFWTRSANHRESILNLPTLTKEDIAEYYEHFTVLREQIYSTREQANRGGVLSAEHRRLATAHVREAAQSG